MDDSLTIAVIVEGPGEVAAAPELLRRIIYEVHDIYNISISAKNAKNKSNLIKKLVNFLEYATIDGCDGILVMIDTDTNECPKDLASRLADIAAGRNLSIPIAIVCPNSEYETWFICALSDDAGQGIRDKLGIDASVVSPNNAECIRGAKEWLRDRSREPYKPTSHQAALTHQIDLDLVHSRSRSFRRLCHAVDELIDAIAAGIAPVTPSIPSDTQPCPSS